jgi:uncharacterized protein (TIGR00297 family)
MPIGLVFTIPARLVLGLIISTFIGFIAHRRGSLSQSGVLGAVITGTLIFGFGGWAAGLTLIAFFVSSSLLSRFKANSVRKQHATEMFDKGGQRDLGQALANGGGAAVLAVLGAFVLSIPNTSPQSTVLISGLWIASMAGLVGALATVNADTWATELGVLSRSKPRLIVRPRQLVEPGTSGGVTSIGLLAALAGAAFVSLIFVLVRRVGTGFDLWHVFISATIGGVVGSLFDSFLGATVQAMYYSEQRQKETEKRFDKDGTPNKLIRGWRWLNNDWVNFIASLFGAAVAAGIAIVIT